MTIPMPLANRICQAVLGPGCNICSRLPVSAPDVRRLVAWLLAFWMTGRLAGLLYGWGTG